VARARVELLEGLSCSVRGVTFKPGTATYVDNAGLIQYLKTQSNFAVVELADLVKVFPPRPIFPGPAGTLPKVEPLVVPMAKPEEVSRLPTAEVVPEAKAEEKKVDPEPLERTPVKPVPRTMKHGSRGRRP